VGRFAQQSGSFSYLTSFTLCHTHFCIELVRATLWKPIRSAQMRQTLSGQESFSASCFLAGFRALLTAQSLIRQPPSRRSLLRFSGYQKMIGRDVKNTPVSPHPKPLFIRSAVTRLLIIRANATGGSVHRRGSKKKAAPGSRYGKPCV